MIQFMKLYQMLDYIIDDVLSWGDDIVADAWSNRSTVGEFIIMFTITPLFIVTLLLLIVIIYTITPLPRYVLTKMGFIRYVDSFLGLEKWAEKNGYHVIILSKKMVWGSSRKLFLVYALSNIEME